jgi:ribosomal protein L37AE/L43A
MRIGRPVVLVSADPEYGESSEDRTFRQVYNLGLLAVVLVIVGVVIWQVVKRTRALRAPISDDECVSCGSKQVTVLGPGTYRCDQCGYEGGSGMAAQKDHEQRERIARMDPAERRASGINDLQEARTLLRAMMGAGVVIGESSSAIGVAQSNLAQAKQHLQLASLKLDDGYLSVLPGGANPSAMAGAEVVSALDSQLLVGNVADSMLAMGSLDGMKHEAQGLLQRINAALTHYTGETPPA